MKPSFVVNIYNSPVRYSSVKTAKRFWTASRTETCAHPNMIIGYSVTEISVHARPPKLLVHTASLVYVTSCERIERATICMRDTPSDHETEPNQRSEQNSS